MSLTHKETSTSRSPSKSSLRRQSGAQNPSARSLLPSPHFESDPVTALHESPKLHNLDDEDVILEESDDHVIPTFQPFFTLIEDTITSEHFHPTVHYIFADDDTDIIAEAACRSLSENDTYQVNSSVDQSREASQSETSSSRLPIPTPGLREHYLVLDVQPIKAASHEEAAEIPTFQVSSAKSLSSEWQILRTSITNAPTMGEDEEGLMLRIEGRGYTPSNENTGVALKNKAIESLDEMVERFKKGLAEVRQVMDASEPNLIHDIRTNL